MSGTTGSKTRPKLKRFPNIIIVGKMQAGKTTAADYLVKQHKYTKVALADPIKELVHHLDSMKNKALVSTFIEPYYPLEKEQKKVIYKILDITKTIPKEFPKDRKRLQYLGTEGIRKHIDDNFWLTLFSNKWAKKSRVVVDDCRFMNEFMFFKNHGYEDIKVVVSDEVQNIRLHELHQGAYDPEILKHPSELDQDKIFKNFPENIIENNSSLDSYYEDIDKWLKKVRSTGTSGPLTSKK